MTGVGVSWSAPAWVGQSDKDYSDLLRKKAEAVTRRDKRRGGKYSVKEAIEAIHQAFHRCDGFDPYDGSKLDPELLGTYSNERSKEKGAAYKREMRQMAQCLRELGFVQDRNATRGPGLSRTRKWRWPGTGNTGAAR